MTIETSRFDPMAHLDTVEDQVELLNDALDTGDTAVVVNVIAMIARARGMTDTARAAGIGRSSLYKAVGPDANPTLETLLRLMDGLKLRLQAQAA